MEEDPKESVNQISLEQENLNNNNDNHIEYDNKPQSLNLDEQVEDNKKIEELNNISENNYDEKNDNNTGEFIENKNFNNKSKNDYADEDSKHINEEIHEQDNYLAQKEQQRI
jgi:hypothetical protein